MEKVLQREVKIPISDSLMVEYYIRHYGIKSASVIYNSPTSAIVKFSDDSEYLIFILRDVLGKSKNKSGMCFPQPDFDFMIRLEKKLNTYSKCDEYFIRKSQKTK